MPSVKPKPCIQSLIFLPLTSVFLSQRPFSPSSQTTQMSSLERRSPSPLPLWSKRLMERKPVKLRTPWSLMHKIFYPFCTSILRTIMFYPLCVGLCFIRHVCKHFFIFAYLLKLLLMQTYYYVGILLGMCPSVSFKYVRRL